MISNQPEHGYTGIPPEFTPLPTPDEYREPADREPVCPYEPTPPNPFFPSVVDHQNLVNGTFYSLIHEHSPKHIPIEISNMVELDYLAGQAQRHLKNSLAYRQWKRQATILSPELQAIDDEIQLGTVTPTNNLRFMRLEELDSGELTRVFHPYKYRMQYVPEARKAVRHAIVENDGIVYPRVGSLYRKIGIQPNVDPVTCSLRGFLVTYKRDVGHVTRYDNRRIQVIERQSAAIRIDRSGHMDAEMRRKLHNVQGIGRVKGWESALIRGTGFDVFMEEKIQADATDAFIEPLSTMSYAAVETEAQYEARRKSQVNFGHPAVQSVLVQNEGMEGMPLVNPNE